MQSVFISAFILFSLSSLARFYSKMYMCLCCMFCSHSNLALVKFDLVNYYLKLNKLVISVRFSGWLFRVS